VPESMASEPAEPTTRPQDDMIEKALVVTERHMGGYHATKQRQRAAVEALAEAGLLADPERVVAVDAYREVVTALKGKEAALEEIEAALGVKLATGEPYSRLAEVIRERLADPAQTTELPVPWPIAAVGEEPLEPLVSTATVARKRVVQVVAQLSELEDAQRSARFWREQAEGWEHAHQNTVLPYTTKLEDDRDALSLLLRGMARKLVAYRRQRLAVVGEMELYETADERAHELADRTRFLLDVTQDRDRVLSELEKRQARIDAALALLDPKVIGKGDTFTREEDIAHFSGIRAVLVGEQPGQAERPFAARLMDASIFECLRLSGEALRDVEEADDAAGDLP
jgi:hypothetical protein